MKTTITTRIRYTQIVRGHQPHRTGAGTHGDRRLKRQKTRGDRLRNALRD